jgi:hypothetical protein
MTPARHAPKAHLLLRCTCRIHRTDPGRGVIVKTTQPSKSQQLRARLDYPIIDSDGHTFELPSLFMDYLKSAAERR